MATPLVTVAGPPPVSVAPPGVVRVTVTAASGTVSLALTSAGGATLTGGGAATVTDGVATFSGLSVDKAGTYTLTPSTTVSGVSTCQWSPDHVFVVCDQAITADGKPDRALSIYAFDPEKSTYHLFGMSPTGDRPRVTELTISPDQSRWEYLGKAEIKDKTVEFRTVNIFHDADHVEWWSEYSTDNGAHWVRTGEGKESRQK